jgi:hypothetical protein
MDLSCDSWNRCALRIRCKEVPEQEQYGGYHCICTRFHLDEFAAEETDERRDFVSSKLVISGVDMSAAQHLGKAYGCVYNNHIDLH